MLGVIADHVMSRHGAEYARIVPHTLAERRVAPTSAGENDVALSLSVTRQMLRFDDVL